MALIFAVLTLTLLANQVATGLALTIFGIGLSALIGAELCRPAAAAAAEARHSGPEHDLPLVGPILFGQDALVYLSFVALIGVSWFLRKSHARPRCCARWAIPAMPPMPSAMASSRCAICATLFGGAMSGIAGAYFSLAYTPMWAENMTSGRGWIALALVVFAAWRPARLLLGAYLFGGITILQLHIQGYRHRDPLADSSRCCLILPPSSCWWRFPSDRTPRAPEHARLSRLAPFRSPQASHRIPTKFIIQTRRL